MTRNFESMTVAEIRQTLIDEYNYKDSQVLNIKGKSRLALELSKCDDEYSNELKGGFESIEKDSVISEDEENNEMADIVPEMGTKEWEEYVLSQLHDNEKDKKSNGEFPKASGLRRLANKLLGPIKESGPIVVIPPDIDGRATVIYKAVIDWSRSMLPDLRVFTEAADCGPQNTPEPYCKHPVATASTKAEGRVFKKALQLTIMTSEEMSESAKNVLNNLLPDSQSDSSVERSSAAQKDSVNFLCGRLSIDVEKFVASELKNVLLENTTREEAATLLAKLSQYQSKGTNSLEIPEELKVSNGSKTGE